MNGKLVFAFLLTIAALFSNTLASPLSNNFETIQTGNLPISKGLQSICLIPCRNTNTGKVCGSDGKTYPDIGFISCRQSCGADLCKAYDGECTVPPKKKVVCKK